MKIGKWIVLGLAACLACLAPAPAAAQHATTSQAPNGFAPEMVQVTVAATSTPITGTLSAAGWGNVPFTPQLGRPIWLTVSGMFSGAYVGTTTDGNCADAATLHLSGWNNEFLSNPTSTTKISGPVGQESRVNAEWCVYVYGPAGAVTYHFEQ